MQRLSAIDFRPRAKRKAMDIAGLPYAVPMAPGIFLLQPTAKGFALENTLFIQDDINVLFDTGLTYEQMLEVRDAVDLVVNTHAHVGHTSKDYLFDEVWAFEGSADIVEDFERTAHFHGVAGQPWEMEWRAHMAALGAGRGAKVTTRFAAGDVLDFGRTQWRVLLTPGHSPDHCSFYEPNLKLLYAADVTLSGFGPWYGTPLSDLDQFEHSTRQLMALEQRAVATSGKPPMFDDLAARWQAFYDHFAARDRRIFDHLAQPRTITELVDALPIYGRFGSKEAHAHIIRFYEQTMIEKHLARLAARGKIVERDQCYRAL